MDRWDDPDSQGAPDAGTSSGASGSVAGTGGGRGVNGDGGRRNPAGGAGLGDVVDEVGLEEEEAEAEVWLAACRELAKRGGSTHRAGAGPIAHPALSDAVAGLTAAVDGVVGLDGAGCGGADLLETMTELRHQCQRLMGAMGRLAGWYNVSREWRLKNGSAAARMAHRMRAPAEETRALVRLGKTLPYMPAVEIALSAGEIALCHAKALGRLATCRRTMLAFADDEEQLVAWARELGWDEFCAKLTYWRLEHDPDGTEDNAAADEANRRVHLSPGLDGTGILDGILTPLGHATVREGLDRIYDELFQADWAEATERLGREPAVEELSRTPSQRRHDALVRMAERSQTADPNGKRPLPLLSILLDRDTLGQVCEIEQSGTVTTPGTVARLLADYDDLLIERAVFDAPNRLTELSERRLFTGTLRRAIQLRDRHCAWPGCNQPAIHCQTDHVIPDCEDGPTSLDNGQALCRRHNLLKERIRKLLTRRRRRQAQHNTGASRTSDPPPSKDQQHAA